MKAVTAFDLFVACDRALSTGDFSKKDFALKLVRDTLAEAIRELLTPPAEEPKEQKP